MVDGKFLGWVLVCASGEPRRRMPDLFMHDPKDPTMQHLLHFHDEQHPEDAPHRWDRAVTAGVVAHRKPLNLTDIAALLVEVGADPDTPEEWHLEFARRIEDAHGIGVPEPQPLTITHEADGVWIGTAERKFALDCHGLKTEADRAAYADRVRQALALGVSVPRAETVRPVNIDGAPDA